MIIFVILVYVITVGLFVFYEVKGDCRGEQCIGESVPMLVNLKGVNESVIEMEIVGYKLESYKDGVSSYKGGSFQLHYVSEGGGSLVAGIDEEIIYRVLDKKIKN